MKTPMTLGVVFPHTELEPDHGALAAYAQGLEALGLTHVLLYEHVLGAGLENRPDWKGPYSEKNAFHEPFVLFGYWAGLTRHLQFVTGIMVVPQRQTALVAKQAAQVAMVSQDRLRLGIGLGWNEVEYEALDVPYRARAARMEEQMGVLRALWTAPTVTFGPETGARFHTITDAGINPLPARPVPLWIGCGSAAPAIDRVARLADGWVPSFRLAADYQASFETICTRMTELGRDPESLDVQARLISREHDRASWGDVAADWERLGATQLAFSAAGQGLVGVDAHLRFLAEVVQEIPGATGAGAPGPIEIGAGAPGKD